jgi:hypothetical protein
LRWTTGVSMPVYLSVCLCVVGCRYTCAYACNACVYCSFALMPAKQYQTTTV